MQAYQFCIRNPNFDKLGYVVAVANLKDKHDRSALTDYHWKILKCRMLIFSVSSILASPEEKEVKQVHIIFNKVGDDYDKLNSFFLKFSLTQEHGIRKVTPEVFQRCFKYTMLAKMAPVWNTLGYNYLINNRDFLTTAGPQDGVRYNVASIDRYTTIEIKPMKINLIKSDSDYSPGEWIRVLPSLNKAIVDECCKTIPNSGSFKCYKDLRRHWKNIHGYRLPEMEHGYCLIQFWRGEPLTYPALCVTRHFPIVTPMPRPAEKMVLSKFFSCLSNKMPVIVGTPLQIQQNSELTTDESGSSSVMPESQAVSLCTPTQGAAQQRR